MFVEISSYSIWIGSGELPTPPDPLAIAPAVARVSLLTRSVYGGITTKIVAAENDQSSSA